MIISSDLEVEVWRQDEYRQGHAVCLEGNVQSGIRFEFEGDVGYYCTHMLKQTSMRQRTHIHKRTHTLAQTKT